MILRYKNNVVFDERYGIVAFELLPTGVTFAETLKILKGMKIYESIWEDIEILKESIGSISILFKECRRFTDYEQMMKRLEML